MNPAFLAEPPHAPLTTPPASDGDIMVDPQFTAAQQKLAAEKRAAAFAAAPFYWRAQKLAPLAIGRESFWHQHRAALNCPPHYQLMGDLYSFQADTARLLFLLTHDMAEVLQWLAEAPRGELRPDPKDDKKEVWIRTDPHVSLEQRITAWWETQMQNAVREDHVAAYELVINIWDRKRANQAVPKNNAGDEAGAEAEEEADAGNAPGL